MFQRTQTQGKGKRRLRSVAPRRRGGALKVVVLLLVLGGLAAGGYAYWSNRAQTTKKVNVIFATVEKGTFVHEVNGKGSAESAKNVDVASQVEGSATVIYLVPEGQDVKKGQLLVELDSSDIDEKYGHMLSCGATSFWETMAGWRDFGEAGSLCHGWSALPAYYFHKLL